MAAKASPLLVLGQRVLLAVLVTMGVACSTLSAGQLSAALAPGENGAILERAPCSVNTDRRAFAEAVNEYFLKDILEAKLNDELAARPLLSSFPYAENLRLAAAAQAGRCERVMYRSSGLRVAGYVLRPNRPGPHPVLIWLRGGNREFGKIEQVTLLNLQWMADAGFIVVATQYRGADGGEGRDEFGGADVDDVMALLPLARSLPDADVGRMYLLGGSRGAMEGTMAMRRGLPVRAAAFRGGVFDLHALLTFRPYFEPAWREMIPDFDADHEGVLQRRSAIGWAAELHAPVLLLHGRLDWRADVEGSQAFDAMLARAGTDHKIVIYPGDEHQLALHRPEWLQEAANWFRHHGAFGTGPSGQP